MTLTWPTFGAAAHRVETLQARYGVWPGIICHRDGTCTLTCDPQVTNG